MSLAVTACTSDCISSNTIVMIANPVLTVGEVLIPAAVAISGIHKLMEHRESGGAFLIELLTKGGGGFALCQLFLGKMDPNEQTTSQQIYGQTAGAGFIIAAGAASMRVLRVILDHRTPAIVIFTDVLPRFGAAVGMIAIGETVLIWPVNQS